jgi:ribosome-interacting GTPase 1
MISLACSMSIAHRITIDQFLEALRKDLEAKNAANVVAALADCSFKQRLSMMAEEYKSTNIETTYWSDNHVLGYLALL